MWTLSADLINKIDFITKEILAVKAEDPEADVKDKENEINECVYMLYGGCENYQILKQEIEKAIV